MNFEEFKEQLMEDLKAYLPNEIGEGVDVQANSVQKLQNESYEGIVVKKDSQYIGVNMNAEQLYSDLQQGKSYDDVFHYAIDIVQRGFEGTPQVDLTTLMNYELLKDTIMCQVIPVKGNEEMLSTLPHQQMEDIAVVYRFNVGRDDNGIASILINNEMLDRYGVTKEQLFADAEISAPLKEPVSIRTMTEVLMDMMGEEFGEFMGDIGADSFEGPNILVATNESKVHGAAVMAYPDFMEQAAEATGGSFFVLPSSVHEILLVPDDGEINHRILQDMVLEVNSTQVAPNEQLSDNVYHYDADAKVFELADKFEARIAVKDADRDTEKAEKGSVLKDLDKKAKEVADKGEKTRSAPKKSKDEESL
ncbi:MAG: hypothetical protein HUJ70_15370 [Pseudobutyrivibrio sp.]|nr:hypothetical protein [Pseudobutyrivibrio sp.]